jgi:hypothetical protein
MKVLLGAAAVAALLIATPAMAQDTPAAAAACGNVEPAPDNMPDGASANRSAVEAYTQRFNAWAEATNQVLACKRAQAEAARAEADRLTTEFNAQNSTIRGSVAAWTAEVEEFNARGVSEGGRDRRSRGVTNQ